MYTTIGIGTARRVAERIKARIPPVEVMPVAPNSENNALALAAAAREYQRRNAGRGRQSTALSMNTGGAGTLG